MTLWNVELFSVTDALITLNIPSTNQIAENYSLRNSLFIWELKIAILSPERHIGNISTEI